jgi:hypothetical protein
MQPSRAHRSRRSTGGLLLLVEAVASAELSQTLARDGRRALERQLDALLVAGANSGMPGSGAGRV